MRPRGDAAVDRDQDTGDVPTVGTGQEHAQEGGAVGGRAQNASNVANAFGICGPAHRSLALAGQFHTFGAVVGVAELLAVPGLEAAAPEEPVVADTFVRVPVGERLVEPVLGFEHVVLGPAVDDAVRVVVVVEVDDVVARRGASSSGTPGGLRRRTLFTPSRPGP